MFGRPSLSAAELINDAIQGFFSKGRYEILPAGAHEYNFAFLLPPALPADFESGGSSRIAYELTAWVDLPLEFDVSTKTLLRIYEPFDASQLGAGKSSRVEFEVRLPDDTYSSSTTSTLVNVTHAIGINFDVPWAIDLNVALPITIVEKPGSPSGRADRTKSLARRFAARPSLQIAALTQCRAESLVAFLIC
jgi:hypothetical protein